MTNDELLAIQAMPEAEAATFQRLGDEADADGRSRESTALRAGMAALRRMSALIEGGEHWNFIDTKTGQAD
ncbi:hypothetical protein [Altererythrobacter sp. GH1-8]|uniref:hypothetical protein n=1 Tax=Altererythrobacter sp. GH1-8 TaxID=3349333 RepID=UPI00374D0433